MLRVEETLASYLSHGMMFSLKDKFFLIDVFISPYGLFGIDMSTVIQRFIKARVQSVAFEKFIPIRGHGLSAPTSPSDPQPGPSLGGREGESEGERGHPCLSY